VLCSGTNEATPTWASPARPGSGVAEGHREWPGVVSRETSADKTLCVHRLMSGINPRSRTDAVDRLRHRAGIELRTR
jgi:hypothetical protein